MKVKKILSITLVLVMCLSLLPITASAADATVSVTGKTVAAIQSEIQAALDNAANTTVEVTGSKTGTDSNELELDIPSGKKVEWKAVYELDSGLYNDAMILRGPGELEIAAGGSIVSYSRNAIWVQSANATITVNGGTIKSDNDFGFAIDTGYDGLTINLLSGNVVTTSIGGHFAIGTSNLKITNVNMSGGTVSATSGNAIKCLGTLTVSGGTISTGSDWQPAITAKNIIISGDPIIISSGAIGIDVSNDGSLSISGGTISNTGTDPVIYTEESPVTISGGTINGYVYVYGTLSITGGAINGDYSCITLNQTGGTINGERRYFLTVIDCEKINDDSYGAYRSGASVSITAETAPAGQVFDKWTGGDGGTFGNAFSETTTFTMPANDATITATFKPIGVGSAPTITSAANTSVVSGIGGTFQATATSTTPITYSLTGTVPAGVTINSTSGLITIAATVPANIYNFNVVANNGISPNATQAFTLSVTAAPVAPTITGLSAMSLTVGYAATSTTVYTIGGTAPVVVTKTSGEPAITWNSATQKLDIAAGLAAGTYPVVLTASNGVSPDATLTFTLTVQSYSSGGTGGSGGGVSSYSVSFNTNGGSAIASRNVNAGAKLAAPTNPTKQGYTFDGWYTDSALKNAYDFDKAVFSSFTLYAKWTAGTAGAISVKLSIGSASYTVNGVTKTMDVKPYIVDGRTMVPLRFIAEALGAKVDWNGDTETAIVTLDGKVLSVKIGALAPGMDVPAVIKDSRTMVPLRYLGEALGCKVEWNPDTGTIVITK